MSKIDKLMEKLKSAALKLNCEQWQTRNGFSGVEVIVKGSVAKGHGCVSYQPVASELVDAKTAKAIALFCPANILALLDELEAKDKQIAELEAREVELPPLVDCSNVPFAAYSWNAYRAEAVKALRSAGITAKGDSE